MSSFASLGVRQQASNAAAGLGSSLANLGLRKRSEWRRRGIVSKDRGVVIAQPPPGGSMAGSDCYGGRNELYGGECGESDIQEPGWCGAESDGYRAVAPY